jgi:hypothetical protein
MSLHKSLLAVLVPVVALLVAAPAGPAGAVRPEPAAHAKLGIPRTYDAAVSHFEHAKGDVLPMKRFKLPSGNIYCALAVPHMPKGCEINEGAIKDPAVCSGVPVSKYVGRIEFQGGRATPVCNTDTIQTPGAKVLPYGSAAHVRNSKYTCLSETIGVTCINLVDTEGFFLHRGEYVIFNAG